MSHNSIVIVGAGQAGYQVAASLRQEGFEGAVTLIGDEPGVPYQRPPLSKAYLLGKVGVAALRFRPPEYFDEHRITRIQGSATAIDRERRELVLASGERLAYEHLVLATGARNRVPAVAGIELGVERAVDQLVERAAMCPDEVSVLVGFSQGAMVMHRAVDRVAAEAPELLDRLAGVLLIADGDRFPTDGVTNFGSAETRVGYVGVGHMFSAGEAAAAIPAALHGRVVSVCDAGDPVCDPRSVSLDAYERHTGYKVGHREARDAAEHVAALAAEFMADAG